MFACHCEGRIQSGVASEANDTYAAHSNQLLFPIENASNQPDQV